MAILKYGYGNRPVIEEHADYFVLSAAQTAIHKGSVRVAGVLNHTITSSAGTVPKLRLIDGTSTAGVAVVDVGVLGNGSYPLPFVRLDNLYYEVSGSATGVSSVVLYVVED